MASKDDIKAALREVLGDYTSVDSNAEPITGNRGKKKLETNMSATLEVNLDPVNDGVLVYGSTDGGITQTVIKTDATGKALVQQVALSSSTDSVTTQRGTPTVATYTASDTNFAPAGSATDVFIINGSGSKTIRIKNITVSGTTTTAITTDVQIVKRSTANTGGTFSTLTAVPADSTDSAATAVVLSYTANPTPGTSVGVTRTQKLSFPLSTAANNAVMSIDFGKDGAKEPVLRTSAQGLAVNLRGQTIANGSLNISVTWTEE